MAVISKEANIIQRHLNVKFMQKQFIEISLAGRLQLILKSQYQFSTHFNDCPHLHSIPAEADFRVKRQDDDGDQEDNIEELCKDRPADEYFRLSTDGDCREVVR